MEESNSQEIDREAEARIETSAQLKANEVPF